MYFFMLERVRIARRAGDRSSRWRDWIWLVGFTVAIIGIIAMVVCVVTAGIHEEIDQGVCRALVNGKMTYAILGIDGFLTFSLTLVFIILLCTWESHHTNNGCNNRTSSSVEVLPTQNLHDGKLSVSVQQSESVPTIGRETGLKSLARRTLVAAFISLAAISGTIVAIQLYHDDEPVNLFLTTCIIDGKSAAPSTTRCPS